jgi:cytochrome P450|tara:strand:+ start:2849 stop:4132 length:1284 start_codon:yes stop_codon:yes gene_type:complete
MLNANWQYPFSTSTDENVDLSSYEAFNEGAPYQTFKRMQKEAALVWCDEENGAGFWSVTRHQDIIALNKKAKLLSSAQGIRIEEQTVEEFEARKTFQEIDPPDHAKYRLLMNKAFSRGEMAIFEEKIRDITASLIDKAMALGEFDATQEIACQLPMRMLGSILGVPEEDTEWLVKKGDALISNTDPDYTDFVIDKVNTDKYRMLPFRSPSAIELFDYANQLLKRIRKGEDVGILNLIMQPNKDGKVISDDEFRNFFCLAVAAGNDTTRFAIAASIHALANNPYLLTQLKAHEGDTDFFNRATDEMIRWSSPTTHFRRTATEDFEYENQLIKKGDKVVLWFHAGNYDETIFTHPDQIDFTRSPNRHVSFGQGGPHVCLGMYLAKLELKVVLEELAKRVCKIEQTAQHSYLRSNFILGIKKLPIKFSVL